MKPPTRILTLALLLTTAPLLCPASDHDGGTVSQQVVALTSSEALARGYAGAFKQMVATRAQLWWQRGDKVVRTTEIANLRAEGGVLIVELVGKRYFAIDAQRVVLLTEDDATGT